MLEVLFYCFWFLEFEPTTGEGDMDWGRAKGRGDVNVNPGHPVVPGVKGGVAPLLDSD